MKIAVVGGTFLDLYIYGEEPHSAEIIEDCGGSGLNVAFGLKKLGFEVFFFSNLGDDHRGKFILESLQKENMDVSKIKTCKAKTGFHLAHNEKVIAVDRGANRLPVSIDYELLASSDVLFVNTEVPTETIKGILERCINKTVFLEAGPRPVLDSSIREYCGKLIVIGNERECQRIQCDIVKLGPKGAKWGELFVKGDLNNYSYTIGCGDVFDAVLIASLCKGDDREEALKRAVAISQEAAKRIKGAFNKMRRLIDII